MKKFIVPFLGYISLSYGITMQEALSIAQQNATNIKLTQLELKKAEAQIKEAYSSILPSVSLTATYNRWDPNYIFGFTPINQYSAKVGLTQKIFDRQIYTLIDLARTNQKLQESIKRDIAQKVLDTTRRLYLTVLVNRELYNIKQENLAYWQENFRFVEEKYTAGLVAKYDYVRAYSQFQSAVADTEKAKASYLKSIEDLKRFLMVDRMSEPEENLSKLELDIADDIEGNTEIAVIKAQIELAEKNIQNNKSANYPNLSAFLNYQINNQFDFISRSEVWRKGYNLGLSVNWQIFDGFAKDSRVIQSQIDRTKYEVQLQDKITEIQTEIKKAKLDIQALKSQLAAEEENLKAAKEALRLSTERFKAGIATTLEVLESQTNYYTAWLNYLSALYSYNLRLFDLLNLTGR